MKSSGNEIVTGTSKRKSLLFKSKVFHAKNATLTNENCWPALICSQIKNYSKQNHWRAPFISKDAARAPAPSCGEYRQAAGAIGSLEQQARRVLRRWAIRC